MKYKNTGAPIPRAEPEKWIDTGEVFEPTEDELLRLAYKLEKVEDEAAAEPPRSAVVQRARRRDSATND